MKIAFIGIGSMGAAIVPHLVSGGHEVAVWNRSPDAINQLQGVAALSTPTDAFVNHEVVMTMLADDNAFQRVIVDSGAVAAARPGVTHVVMSTLSTALVDRVQPLHSAAGVSYVAAPVFGVPATAARGELNILAAGATDAVERVMPLFELIGKQVWRLGTEPRHANIAKIAGNLMIMLAIESMAEATALTESHGLPASDFLAVVTQTLFACPSYQRYGKNIAETSYEPGFKLALGLKDVELALQAAADHKTVLPSARIVREHMLDAVRDGLGDKDWSILAQAARGRASHDDTPA